MTLLDSIEDKQAIIWSEGFSAHKSGSKCPYDFGTWKYERWMAGNTEASNQTF